MRTIEFDENKIVIFQSPEELPILRYARFQRYNILDSGVGSTIEDIGLHFSKLFEYLSYNLNSSALQEAKNLYYNYYIILEEISLTGLAFACLIHSINGEILTDYTEENLKLVVKKLELIGLKAGTIINIKEDLKKKFITS